MVKFNTLQALFILGAAILMVTIIQARPQDRLVWPEEMRIALVNTHDFCLGESGASEEVLKQCRGLYIPDEHSSKCYLSCMLEHAHFNETTKTAVILKDVHELTERIHEMTDTSHGNCDHLGKLLGCDIII